MTAKTIHLSDTHDSYKRTIMVTRRNGKTTFVQRWKDRNSGKRHTQRFTMMDSQAIIFGRSIFQIAYAEDSNND